MARMVFHRSVLGGNRQASRACIDGCRPIRARAHAASGSVSVKAQLVFLDYTSGMRRLLVLLFALAMTANAYALAVQTRYCCPDADCTVMQCVEMGCVHAAEPMLAQQAPVLPEHPAVRQVAMEAASALPHHYQEVWTPPD